jgi:hypothetical protein
MDQPTKQCLTIKHLIILVIFSDQSVYWGVVSSPFLCKSHENNLKKLNEGISFCLLL